jgi:hypothetical protein
MPDAGEARLVAGVLGVWLFISAFAWKHSPEQQTNTWVCGLIALGVAMLSSFVRSARYLNAALAVWLFISAFSLPTLPISSVGTTWNNVIVALLLFATSLVGERGWRGDRYLERTS